MRNILSIEPDSQPPLYIEHAHRRVAHEIVRKSYNRHIAGSKDGGLKMASRRT
jgi:hypothetical protein